MPIIMDLTLGFTHSASCIHVDKLAVNDLGSVP